jgi:hypothetical protein
MTKPSTNPPPSGNSTVPIVLALLAVGGGGYWYLNSTGKDVEIKDKAHGFQQASETRAKELKQHAENKAEAYKVGGRTSVAFYPSLS